MQYFNNQHSRLLISLVAVFATMAACGGSVRYGFTWYVKSPDRNTIARLATVHVDRFTPDGVIMPVAMHCWDDEYAIIDVFAAYPIDLWSPTDIEQRFAFVDNYFSAFEAADGRGFELRDTQGGEISLLPMNYSTRPDIETRNRYELIDRRDLLVVPVTAGVHDYNASCFSVFVRCSRSVHAGESVRIKCVGRDSYMGAPIVGDEVVLVVQNAKQ